MSDFVDINSGVFPMPEQPGESQLEVVIDPKIALGSMDMAPGAKLVRIEHPRLGWLSFLLSADSAANVAGALTARD